MLASLTVASVSPAAAGGRPAAAARTAGAPSVSLGSAGIGPIVSYRNGKCADDKGGSARSGSPVVLEPCNGSVAQMWSWTTIGWINSTVHVNGPRLCLAPAGNKTANGTKAVLGSCQTWTLNGAGELRNHQTGKCLNDPGGKSANGTQLDFWTCNGSAGEEWLPPATSFYDSDNAGLCLDDRGDKSANGTDVVLWTCDNGTAEMLAFYPAATVDGDYVDALRMNGKCIEANGGGTAVGTKIVLYSCNGSGAEKWRIVYNYRPLTILWDLENPQSGLCLLDPGQSTAKGTQLRLGQCDSSTTSNADWSDYQGPN